MTHGSIDKDAMLSRRVESLHDSSSYTPFTLPAPGPAEPVAGTVLGFEKTLPVRLSGSMVQKTYSYAALHVGRGWYVTGPRSAGTARSWDELLGFIGGPEEWARVAIVTEWSLLVPLQQMRADAGVLDTFDPNTNKHANTSPAGATPAVDWTVGDTYDHPNESGVRGEPPLHVLALRDAPYRAILARDLPAYPHRWFWSDGRSGDPVSWDSAARMANGTLTVTRTGVPE